MFSNILDKRYMAIMTAFMSYLPSRLLVVLNSLIIVPVLAHLLSSKEIGIFQLAIGILNLVCTCSTDWIAKSVLRFYEKYNLCNKLDEFFSNTILITFVVYAVIILSFFLFSDFITAKFLIPKSVLLLTLFLVIPVGIRQFLYQMLRVLNRPFLYTFSIVLYQISMLILFLLFSGFLPNVFAVLTAMVCAIFLIDFYILKEISFKINFGYKFNKLILLESLKYALPQIVTNTCIWAILNLNKFVFQYNHLYDDTAVIGVSYLLTSSILTPVFSAFLFAIFPLVIKKFETGRGVKSLVTNSIQLYTVLFLPVSALFCYYGKDIVNMAFSGKYPQAVSVISFFAVGLFFHELMKIFNIKYHLKNKTYIEMAVSFFVGLICVSLNFVLIPKFELVGAGIALLFSILLLFTLNIIVQYNPNYINYKNIVKTASLTLVFGIVSFGFVELVFNPFETFIIIKMIMYLFFSYLLSIIFAKPLLD